MAETSVKYPIGIQNFEMLRKLSYLYVDKTELIYNLVTGSKSVFLSRPRRFGKSLLLSTIQAYFEGKKELFKGLVIDKLETEWTVHPVLSLSLATYSMYNGGNLREILDNRFREWEEKYKVEIKSKDLACRFGNIIKAAYRLTKQPVVILIDDYNTPLLESINDPELVKKNDSLLRSVFVNIKDEDQYIRFAMMTGVSRFCKEIFLGVNNLWDISLSSDYSAICGITEEEMRSNFSEGVERLAAEFKTDYEGAVELLKQEYGGYNFSEEVQSVLNPYSLLNALKKKRIGSYWFDSGSSEFIVRQIQKNDRPLERLFEVPVEDYILSDNDIFSDLTALLYQTGYLTIKEFEMPRYYRLGIPNQEVYKGLSMSLALKDLN